jgi:hypothetical protein
MRMAEDPEAVAPSSASRLTYRTLLVGWIVAGVLGVLLLGGIVSTVPKAPQDFIGVGTLMGGLLGLLLIVVSAAVIGREDGLTVRNFLTVSVIPWGDITELRERGALRVTLRNGKHISMMATSPSPLEAIRGFPRNVRLAAYIRQHQTAGGAEHTRTRPNWFGAALLAGSLLFCIGFPILHGQWAGH